MLNYLIKAISSALGFTKTESRGTLVLIFVIFIAITSSHFRISYFENQQYVTYDSSVIEWMKKVRASHTAKNSMEQDFDKTVFLPTNMYKRKNNPPFKKVSPESFRKTEKKIIITDLNTANVEQLQEVWGIGSVFSKRIIKYRKLLGGFSDTTQLTEVYGLTPETIRELLLHFRIDSPVEPVRINSDLIKVLASHPYISYDLARIIINYRKLHGDIKSADDLKKIKAIDDRTFLRLKPYLEYGYAKNP